MFGHSKKLTPEVSFGKQRGWGCKLYSIAGVTKWLYKQNAISNYPLPARKRDDKEAPTSLRELAKRNLHSSVGELNQAQSFLDLALQHPELTASCLTIKNEKAYIQTLMSAIDNQLAPIVFFDSGDDRLKPINAFGCREHSAIISGYSVNWIGTIIFNKVDTAKNVSINAHKLFTSSSQLKESDTAPIKYLKMRYSRTNKGCWFPEKSFYDFYSPEIFKKPAKKPPQRYETNLHKLGGLRNKIILIDTQHRINEYVKNLKINLENFKNYISPISNAKRAALQKLIATLESNPKRETLFELLTRWLDEKVIFLKKEITHQELMQKQVFFGLFACVEEEIPYRILDGLSRLPKVNAYQPPFRFFQKALLQKDHAEKMQEYGLKLRSGNDRFDSLSESITANRSHP